MSPTPRCSTTVGHHATAQRSKTTTQDRTKPSNHSTPCHSTAKYASTPCHQPLQQTHDSTTAQHDSTPRQHTSTTSARQYSTTHLSRHTEVQAKALLKPSAVYLRRLSRDAPIIGVQTSVVGRAVVPREQFAEFVIDGASPSRVSGPTGGHVRDAACHLHPLGGQCIGTHRSRAEQAWHRERVPTARIE